MKFGMPKKLSHIERLIYLIFFLIVVANLSMFDFDNFNFYMLLGGWIGALLVISGSSSIRFLRNKENPLFEVKDDMLFYKTHWGLVRQYPIEKFNGKIETYKVLFEERLKTPKLTETKDYLFIGLLNKKDKALFIDKLREQVALFNHKKKIS